MKNLNNVYDVLRQEKQFLDNDGNIFKNKVCEYARKMDKSLLKLLYNNELTRELFFIDIDDLKVFDSQRFNNYIENKDFLPDSYTSFKNNIGLFDKVGNSINDCEDVVLQFPYKDCVLEFDSTKESDKRNEIFFNEILMKTEIDVLLDPKVLTNVKKYDKKGVRDITEIDDRDNLIIKGNNLLTLYSLLPKYKGKIKCMYWDILYNTNNDQVPYNDSFKHSSWLTMMKNRLEIANKLLHDEGIILIHCDKNEDAYLKVLCDEIFSRDNFVNSIAIQSSTPSGNKTTHKDKTIIKIKDTILIYKKGSNINLQPQYYERKSWDSHYNSFLEILDKDKNKYKVTPLKDKLIEEGILTFKDSIKENIINNDKFYKFYIENKNNIFSTAPSMPKDIKEESKKKKNILIKYNDTNGKTQYALNGRRIVFLSNSLKMINGREKLGILLCDIWTDIDFNNTQNEGGNSLPNGKKPEYLLKRIIDMFTDEGDIVLDAYLGSGTTAAVAHKMNRQYIGIEQLDSHVDKSLQRMQNVINGDQTGISQDVNWQGGGAFVYCELKKLSQLFIDKVNKVPEEKLISIYEELKDNQFVSYRVDINKVEKNKKGFLALSEDKKRRLLIDIIDKNMLYVNYSDIEDEAYNISQNDKLFNYSFYK